MGCFDIEFNPPRDNTLLMLARLVAALDQSPESKARCAFLQQCAEGVRHRTQPQEGNQYAYQHDAKIKEYAGIDIHQG